MPQSISVEFTLADGLDPTKFLHELSAITDKWDGLVGFRADDQVERRAALRLFVDQMEMKLRKNDHKTGWRLKPIEALYKLLKLEMHEFEVAFEHFPVNEARPELIDIANFALIVWDRLSMLDQERSYPEQTRVDRPSDIARDCPP
jgi:hypothetical protein